MLLEFLDDEYTFKGLARRLEQELAASPVRNDRDALIAACMVVFTECSPRTSPDILMDGAAKFIDQLNLPHKPKLSLTQQSLARAFTGKTYQDLKATWPSMANR